VLARRKNLGEFSGGTMVRSVLDGVNKGFDFPKLNGKVDQLSSIHLKTRFLVTMEYSWASSLLK
jgi:hypothetical protein